MGDGVALVLPESDFRVHADKMDVASVILTGAGRVEQFVIPTDAQMAAAKTVIEDRLVGLGITDYESYVDNNKNRIIVRFPWKSDEADFNPQPGGSILHFPESALWA